MMGLGAKLPDTMVVIDGVCEVREGKGRKGREACGG